MKRTIFIYIFLLISCSDQMIQEKESNKTLDIITWNIENFPKSNQTVDYVTNIINQINIDIIALQEIENQESFDLLINQLSDNWVGYRASDDNWGQLSYLFNLNNIQVVDYPYTILNDYEHYFAYRLPYVVKISFNNEEFILINIHFKCCGDGLIDDDYWDEEYRRLKASQYLKEYIDTYFSDQNVIVLGDFNDDIAENNNNVFIDFINDSDNYFFSDIHIAEGPSSEWSFPNWPSHLDHILITNEVFNNSFDVKTLKLEDDIIGGWGVYNNHISDHRPVRISLP